MADYTTLANIKARIPIDTVNSADDAFISALITRASAMIDQYTDNHFTLASAQTHKFDLPRNRRRLLFDDWLSGTITVTNGNAVVIPSTEYVLEDYNNPPYYALVLKEVTSYFFQPDSRMNYRKVISVLGDWGWYTSIPADITEVCESKVVRLYRSRGGENMTGSSIITPAGVVQTPQMWTADEREVLDGYKRTILSTNNIPMESW